MKPRPVTSSPARRRVLGGCLAWLVPMGFAPAVAQVQQRRFAVGAFDAVEIDLPCDVELAWAATASVVGRAELKVLDALVVAVENRTLKVAARAFQSRQPITLRIGFVALHRLAASAAGLVTLQALEAPEFRLSIDGAVTFEGRALNLQSLAVDSKGSGDITLRGQTKRQRVVLAGAGSYHAAELSSDEATLQLEGSGDAEVKVSHRLDVDLNGAGDVRYRGQPKVRKRIEGAGSVIPMD